MKTAGSRDAGLPYSRIPLTAPHPPGNRNYHFDRPWLVRHDDHPRRFRRAGLLIEQSHASDEGIHVATPVRVIGKDEVPTAALYLIHACSPSISPFLRRPDHFILATFSVPVCIRDAGCVLLPVLERDPSARQQPGAARHRRQHSRQAMAAMSESLLYERPAETARCDRLFMPRTHPWHKDRPGNSRTRSPCRHGCGRPGHCRLRSAYQLVRREP